MKLCPLGSRLKGKGQALAGAAITFCFGAQRVAELRKA